MPRHARKKSSTRTYHVVIKGADSQILFVESKDYLKYLEILHYYKHKFSFKLYAYCLMSNHVHLLIQHSAETTLETIFRHINTTYAIWFNQKYHRTGYVQDGRYFSEPVETERYLLTVLRYIHYNPAKAGLESKPGSGYYWSSFDEYAKKMHSLTDTEFIIEIFGSLEQFLIYHDLVPTDDCFDIHKYRKRLPDDVAKNLIQQTCFCNSVTDFQNFSLTDRNHFILLLHKKGISIRQLNRLTGIPRGIIERVIANDHSST